LGEPLRAANLPAMNTPQKSTRRELAERLTKLWKNPAVEQAKKTAATYLANALARLNEVLGSRNSKK
jgi:hypothetical protein